MQRRLRVDARHAQRRQQPESDGRRDGEAERDGEHAPVHLDLVDARQARRRRRYEEPQESRGERDAGDRAAERQHAGLDEDAAEDADARRAERGADPCLAAARRGPDEHEVGDIDARHEQRGADGRQQQVEPFPALPRDPLVQRDEPRVQALTAVESLGRDRALNGFELGERRFG